MAGKAMTYLENMIRPRFNENQVTELVKRHYGLVVTEVKTLDSYLGQNLLVKVKVNEIYDNPHISEVWPHGFVLKILNSEDSQTNHVEAQHACQRHLASNNLVAPIPIPTKDGMDVCTEILSDGSSGPVKHLVHMLQYIPGTQLKDAALTEDVLFQVGRFIGNSHHILKDFSHPAASDVNAPADSMERMVPQMRQFLSVVSEPENRQAVEQVIQAFKEEIMPHCHKFKKGFIHGDMHSHNLLVLSDHPPCKPGDIPNYGIIDFGDVIISYYVFDLAISIMHFILDCTAVDPLLIGGYILSGYLKENSLNEEEIKALSTCVMGRFVHIVTMTSYMYFKEPRNEYLLNFIENGWSLLRKLQEEPKDILCTRWMKIVESNK